MRTNNLIAAFSYTHSSTLSVPFKSYCMNVYGSQLWSYNDYNEHLKDFTWHGEKLFEGFGVLIKGHIIYLFMHNNNCLPISLQLGKRCIKFIWNLINSPFAVHKSVINGSFCNKGSTISENIRYFMYKYDINMYDWGKPLNIVMKKVYAYGSLYIQMLIINVMQMPLSIYAKIETIKDSFLLYYIDYVTNLYYVVLLRVLI